MKTTARIWLRPNIVACVAAEVSSVSVDEQVASQFETMYPVVELGIVHVESKVHPESAKVPEFWLHVATALPL
jgi:hypothetical protein